MKEVKIYHNPNCSKSRETLELLKSKNIKLQIIEYMKNSLSKNELKKIIFKLKISPMQLLRVNENEYKELVKKYGIPNNDTAIDWMMKFPKLIQRPIVVTKNNAKIGRPPENILEIL